MANITTQNNIRYSIDSVGNESEFALTVNYYLGAGKVVAPVTFVKWTAEGLPEGLTLSENGLLSGSVHVNEDDVTTENGWSYVGGTTYIKNIKINTTLTTNWGSATNRSIIILNAEKSTGGGGPIIIDPID